MVEPLKTPAHSTRIHRRRAKRHRGASQTAPWGGCTKIHQNPRQKSHGTHEDAPELTQDAPRTLHDLTDSLSTHIGSTLIPLTQTAPTRARPDRRTFRRSKAQPREATRLTGTHSFASPRTNETKRNDFPVRVQLTPPTSDIYIYIYCPLF